MDPQSISLVTTLLFVFIAAVAGGFLAHALKLPMVLGYILMGIVCGNLFSQFAHAELLTLIADVGVTLLLFTLGIELSFHRLRRTIRTIVWPAFLQIVFIASILFTVFFGFLNMSFLSALFIAIAGSLSSTVVVVKILSEKGEMDTVPGEMLTSWLVVQDLFVIPVMIVLPGITAMYTSGTATVPSAVMMIGLQLAKAAAVLFFVLFIGKTGIPYILSRVARLGSREVYLITTIGIVFLCALAAYMSGLSAGLGAFIAGLVIAETSQNHMVFAEVRPLRDIFSTVFFVSLGMSIPLVSLGAIWPIFIGVSLGILLLKWGVVYALCRFLRYHQKTSWLVAVGLLSMSEFGFILAKEGVALGALSSQDFVLLIALVVGMIAISSPVMLHGQSLYYRFHRHFGNGFHMFPPASSQAVRQKKEELPFRNHVVICGYGRVGRYIGRAFEMVGVPLVVVDYNYTTIMRVRQKGITVVYGDPADRDVLDKAQVDFAKAIIIAIPDRHSQELIIGHALTLNKHIQIICRTHHEEDQAYLKSLGVHTIVQPEFEAALAVVYRLLPQYGVDGDDLSGKISRLKIEHGVG